MPRPEEFHAVECFNRSKEQRAIKKARGEFELWKYEHPIEAAILDLLDVESKHKGVQIDRRVKLFEAARDARRKLGFGDHMGPYVRLMPFQIDEELSRNNVVLQDAEMTLLKEVNHGSWARVGFFTKGVRRLQRLG